MSHFRLSLFTIIPLFIATTSQAWTGKVIRVVDGDTIEINYQDKKERVSLLYVDTPESVHRDKKQNVSMGKVASIFTKKQLLGKDVTLELGDPMRDKYGRLLAYVFIDGQNFNIELVRQGLSPYYVKYGQSLRYDDELRDAERLAKKEKLNIWGDETLTQVYNQKISDWKEFYKGTKAKLEALAGKYIGSSKSLIFHKPDCQWGQRISEKNKIMFQPRQEALDAGYQPGKGCNP
jgi:micrococcal nuclease